MRKTDSKPLVLRAAAAFVAAVFLPALAEAQDTPVTDPAGQSRPERMGQRSDLGLTPEQQRALEEFRKARLAESRAFREERSKLRSEIRELARTPRPDQNRIDALIDKAAKLRADGEKAAFRARTERDKIFTPEQLEKLKARRTRFGVRAGLAGSGRPARSGFGPGRTAHQRALRRCRFSCRRGW